MGLLYVNSVPYNINKIMYNGRSIGKVYQGSKLVWDLSGSPAPPQPMDVIDLQRFRSYNTGDMYIFTRSFWWTNPETGQSENVVANMSTKASIGVIDDTAYRINNGTTGVYLWANNAKFAFNTNMYNAFRNANINFDFDHVPVNPTITKSGSTYTFTPSTYWNHEQWSECFKNVQNMHGIFFNDTKIKGAPVITPNATDMNNAYSNCSNLTGAPYIPYNVTTLFNAYSNCSNLTGGVTINQFNIDFNNGVQPYLHLTTMNNAFHNCKNLNGDIDIICYSLHSAPNAFRNCTNIKSVNIAVESEENGSPWFSNMFRDCTSLKSVQFHGGPYTRAHFFSNMFDGCTSLEHAAIPLGTINEAGLSIAGMYANCTNLKTSDPIGSGILSISRCFENTQLQELSFYNYGLTTVLPILGYAFGTRTPSSPLLTLNIPAGSRWRNSLFSDYPINQYNYSGINVYRDNCFISEYNFYITNHL